MPRPRTDELMDPERMADLVEQFGLRKGNTPDAGQFDPSVIPPNVWAIIEQRRASGNWNPQNGDIQMPPPKMPRPVMDQIPPGALAGDDPETYYDRYSGGRGHDWVNPRFSKRTNMNITNRMTTDGNIAGLEELYGNKKYAPDPYSGSDQGLSPRDLSEGQRLNRSFDQVAAEMRDLFGEESAAQILDEVLRVSAFQDQGGKMELPGYMTEGDYGGGTLPRPDFGNQQPYTTGPAGDGDMVALEQYYGYPVSANNLTGNPNAPVRNMPGSQGQPRLPKGRRSLTRK